MDTDNERKWSGGYLMEGGDKSSGVYAQESAVDRVRIENGVKRKENGKKRNIQDFLVL